MEETNVDRSDQDGSGETMRLKDFIPAAALVAVCIGWLAVATLRPLPGQTQVGVVFPPTLDSLGVMQRIAAADARIVRVGGWPFIAIVTRDHADTLDRLARAGALFTINPKVLGGCLAGLPGRTS